MALTKVSFSMIAGSVANMLDYGIVGDGIANDTAAAQAALDSGASVVVVPPGSTIGVTGLTMAANQTLWIQGKIKMLSGAGPVVLVNNGCTVLGGEIDGNSVNCSGVVGTDKVNVTVEDVYIHDLGKVGIVSYKGTGQPENWRIANNRVENTTEQGISVEYTNNCLIIDNRVSTALHGIQWWGGDSNVSQTKGIYALRIQGNLCSNVMGGIWGSLGANISVVNNHVENCSDVGIDFEGCDNFTCTGNVAYECANGCYAIFFGCTNGTFTGNVAKNVSSNKGSGFYATTNTSYRNEGIVIANNTFSTIDNYGLYATDKDGLSLSNSVIEGNRFSSTGNVSSIYLIKTPNISISGNHMITVGSSSAVFLVGTEGCTISDNWMYGQGDTATSPVDKGGIILSQFNATWPCINNTVKNNRVENYNYSINDNPYVNPADSKNDIQWNRVSNIYRRTGAGYTGVIANNTDTYAPATAITPTLY